MRKGGGLTNDEKTRQWLSRFEKGVEIGAFLTPLPNIRPTYVDSFESFGGHPCKYDILCEATELPFEDGELEYVATSHVFEHIANPIQALVEWTRVTSDNGILYLVIPDRRFTWERNRAPVDAAHLLEDYRKGITQCDGTHIDEFIDGLVWEEFSPSDPSEEAREAYRQSLRHAVNHDLIINIHYHAFEPEGFDAIVDAANTVLPAGMALERVDGAERFPSNEPNGFLAVLRVGRGRLD